MAFTKRCLYALSIYLGVLIVILFETVSTTAEQFDIEDVTAEHLGSLKQVHVIVRHGDRTPNYRYPLDPYNSRAYWPEGWGQLTKLGKRQQYELGQYIRQRYDGFLERGYAPEELCSQASYYDRCIQSAMALLRGMWPPVTNDSNIAAACLQQYVPSHTFSPETDNKIGFTKPCPRYKQLFDLGLRRPSETLFDEENKSLFEFLTENTGLNITTYLNATPIYDILNVQQLHNLTLPEWTKSVFPDKILQLEQRRFLEALSYSEEMLRLIAGPLLTHIIGNNKRIVDNTPGTDPFRPDAKMYMYMGHETTIVPMLIMLDAFDGAIPNYCASLYFELHKSDTGYFVKIFYRVDKYSPIQELKIKKCPSIPCAYEDFVNSFGRYIVNETEWEKECQVTTS